MSEKFNLKWIDFESNVSKSFGKLRNEENLHDVTLVGDDHTQMSAHKLVLSACSEYFKDVFKRNKHSNTLMCLEGLSRKDLENILDYIYNGEIHIYQKELDRFLSVAQRFKLEGLLESEENEGSGHVGHGESDYVSSSPEYNEDKSSVLDIQPKKSKPRCPRNTDSLNTSEMNEIDAKLMENLEPMDDGHLRCTICGKDSFGIGKKGDRKHRMKDHVETHIEGLSYPCQLCGKECRSKQSLSDHKRRKCFKHKNSFQDENLSGKT